MRKNDLEIKQVVMLNRNLVTIVSIGKYDIIVETEGGRRQYTNAGSLLNPIVTLQIPLSIKIVPDTIGYHVYCPQLKGFHTCGETISECLRNAQAAGEGFIKTIIKHYNEEIK